MAYRPSYRRTRKTDEDLQPNMTPIMNLMVVLIPLLLSSAQLIKIGVLELNLPPAKQTETTEENQSSEESPKLELAITITDNGFYISSATAILKSDDGPSVPLKNGEYDYESLADKLYQIKQKAAERFQDNNSITIQAEPEIDYQTLISTMDASRAITIEGKRYALFPNVSVSASVL